MKLIRRDDSQKQHRPAHSFPSLFDESLWDHFPIAFFGHDNTWQNDISVDISETDTEVIIEGDVPGYRPENITVEIDHDMVSIRGTMQEETEEKKKKYHRKERRYGEFCREFTLPNYVDTSKASSKIKNGTLTITIPKKKEARKSLKVEVE